MPRSGTSLCARIVQSLGFDFGPEKALAPADHFNPDGYLERQDLVEFGQSMIGSLGGRNVIPGPGIAEEQPNFAEWVEKAETILAEVEVLKIPRAAFLLPVWQAAAPTARWVICLRHPSEVAASWERAYGVGHDSALDIWVEYNARFASLPVGRSMFVSYDRWFNRPTAQLERLAYFLTRHPLPDVLKLVNTSRRHNVHEGPSGHAEADALYERLIRCV